jgi:hypothetical protein
LANVGSSRDRTAALPAAADALSARTLPSAAATRSLAALREVLRLRTRARTSFSSRCSDTMSLRVRKASTSRRLATTVASSFFTSSSACAVDSLVALRNARPGGLDDGDDGTSSGASSSGLCQVATSSTTLVLAIGIASRRD